MAFLSAQSIQRRCVGDTPLIIPFQPEKRVVRGKSAGLSSSSYDLCISEDIELGVNPGYILSDHIIEYSLWPWHWHKLRQKLRANELPYSLAFTVEDVMMPNDLLAFIIDKSTYARCFLSAMNTLQDPGFYGNLTLEMVNFSNKPLSFKAGDPICQIVFGLLDEPTDKPYTGKYQGQTKAAHAPRHENADGTWT